MREERGERPTLRSQIEFEASSFSLFGCIDARRRCHRARARARSTQMQMQRRVACLFRRRSPKPSWSPGDLIVGSVTVTQRRVPG